MKEQKGVGENTADQKPPQSSLCRERMMEVIKNTEITRTAAMSVLEIVNRNPELDGQFCLLFGIKPHAFNPNAQR